MGGRVISRNPFRTRLSMNPLKEVESDEGVDEIGEFEVAEV